MVFSFLDIFRGKKTPRTKKTQAELKKAGVTKKDLPSDVDKKQGKKTTKLSGQPKRKVPPTTKENIDRAYRIAMMLKKKNKKKNKK